jgi:UDP-2,4-diacetamido-2,4,6-trideoxy-beta-L-altropyranose hydrolase
MAADKHLIIRADADDRIGTGHIMRCLALAEAWNAKGGSANFVTNCRIEGIQQRIQKKGFEVSTLLRIYPHSGDWDFTKGILQSHPGAWVVVDGYHFDDVYQKDIKQTNHPLLVVDGLAQSKHYYADIVLNQNLHAKALDYNCEPYTRLLLGTDYVLLRSEFTAIKSQERRISKIAKRLLLTMGGSDPRNHTMEVIRSIDFKGLPIDKATVIVGASNPYTHEIEAAVQKSRLPIRIVRDTEHMARLMADADVAISAAGSTAWELLFMGVPSLFVSIADNQEPVGSSIERECAGVWINSKSGEWSRLLVEELHSLIFDVERRLELHNRGQSLVDGLGATRVVRALEEWRHP